MDTCPQPQPGECAWCHQKAPRGKRCCTPDCQDRWADQHVWRRARALALARASYQCELCGALDLIDVHHRTPVDPFVGYRPGCAHHQENLQALCRIHHVLEHRAQRAKPGEQLRLPVAA